MPEHRLSDIIEFRATGYAPAVSVRNANTRRHFETRVALQNCASERVAGGKVYDMYYLKLLPRVDQRG
ncbi:hypothetical protein DAEQUDRAFT_732866 [Daedalea quercina L-15889]|uniref:Uncharacterized protein n=1 Tax=Daedalea quercina L-15889 TaxID=1314783 RepID=A0A165LD08_9APHY|nr:hypothetical protein DAEQUDRAFT_732866 [Daedalea quercina L-15889]